MRDRCPPRSRAGGALCAAVAGALCHALATPDVAAQTPSQPAPAPLPAPRVRPTAPRQGQDSARSPNGRRQVACNGQPIHDVVILPQQPYSNALLGRLKWVERVARDLHATTRASVVRRFLVLNPGEPCDELRRSESERILRAQPFLVDARVRAYDDERGGVTLEVTTRDEFSTIIALEALRGGGRPPVSNIRFGEANLMGEGMYALAGWSAGRPGYQNGGIARFTDYQFLGRPYQLNALAERRNVTGRQWAVDASHPFYTDLQRVAWRVSGGVAMDEYIDLHRPALDNSVITYDRRHGNVGGLLRVGVPGRLSLFGAAFTYEEARTHDAVRVLSDSGLVTDGATPLDFVPSQRYGGERVTRANLLWGVRSVRFLQVTGFETLAGTQDVRVGFQAGAMLGRSVQLLHDADDDYYGSADVYLGGGSPRSFVATTLRGEARHDNRLNVWNGIVAGGRTAWYIVPSSRFRVVTSGEFGATRRPRTPTQLPLGSTVGGVRGYGGVDIGGASRAAVRLEPRYVFGQLFGLGDFGAAAFVDAGKVWAGDAPYGVTTPVRASAGVGLLGAFPRGSRRLWRVDVAMPLTRVPGARRFQLIFDNRDLTRLFWREPREVEIARERGAPSSVFNWPQ